MYKRLIADYKQAVKDNDAFKTAILTIVVAAVKDLEKEIIGSVTDGCVRVAVSKEIRKASQALESAIKAGQQDLIDKENKKILILKSYLPTKITSRVEMMGILLHIGVERQMDMDEAMKIANPILSDRADSAFISKMVEGIITLPNRV